MALAPVQPCDVIPMADGRQRLTLTLSYQGAECTLTLAGSLDVDSVIALESQLTNWHRARSNRSFSTSAGCTASTRPA